MTSVAATLLFPTNKGAPEGTPTPHFGTSRDAAPVSIAPVPFGKSWQRNGYAACVSRAKETRKPITTTNEDHTFPDLSVCLRTALLLHGLCCSWTAMSVEDVILVICIRG